MRISLLLTGLKKDLPSRKTWKDLSGNGAGKITALNRLLPSPKTLRKSRGISPVQLPAHRLGGSWYSFLYWLLGASNPWCMAPPPFCCSRATCTQPAWRKGVSARAADAEGGTLPAVIPGARGQKSEKHLKDFLSFLPLSFSQKFQTYPRWAPPNPLRGPLMCLRAR